jgi:DNA processing protein
MDSKKYWVGFNLVKGIGAVRLQALLDYFGNLTMAWDAPADALLAAGLSQRIVEHLITVRKEVDLDQLVDKIQQQGIGVLTWQDERYPPRLREIGQPPPVLYLKGTILPEDGWSVAVVGTRRVTPYGQKVASELAAYLAQNGVTVVSGLARGVDAIAHAASINAGGRTIAVLGNGIDQVYPPENRKLYEQIIAHGGLLSDYAPGTPPESVNFPPRNRIISGLTMATVVVEAGETSGALITATFAAEQGREVFAVPGSIYAVQSKGTNRLILNGAHPLLEMKDILEELNLSQVTEQRTARHNLPNDPMEVQLFQALSDEPVYIDDLCTQVGLPVDRVSSTLTMMELKGLVRQIGGMNYIAVHEGHSPYTIKGEH